jgi:hypothetical protein
VVFEHVIDALVHGSGYERIAWQGCSDRTIRRRVKIWARLGLAERLHAVALAAYDLIIGMDLSDVSVDGCITKAPCGGEKAGPSPVDRRKGGLKRSVCVEGYGIPVGLVSAGADRHDSPLPNPPSGQHRRRPERCPRMSPRTWTPPMTQASPGSHSTISGWTARSHVRAYRPRSRSVSGGWSSERTHG